jgi:hypothetical protein
MITNLKSFLPGVNGYYRYRSKRFLELRAAVYLLS